MGDNRNKWTKAEDEIVVNRYSREGIKILEFLPGRSIFALRNRVSFFGLKRSDIYWTNDQIDLLKELYPTEGCSKNLMSLLNRKRSTITEKARSLGIKCNNETMVKQYKINSEQCMDKNANFTGYKCITGRYIGALKRGAIERNLDYSLLDKSEDSYKYLYSIITEFCPLSGLKLTFPKNGKDSSSTASLDRIDTTNGYIKGNVRWVHKFLNRFKTDLTDYDFFQLCNLVSILHPIPENKIDKNLSFIINRNQTKHMNQKVKDGLHFYQKLTVEQYKQIYNKYINRENTMIELAAIYGLTRGGIRNIVKRVKNGTYT